MARPKKLRRDCKNCGETLDRLEKVYCNNNCQQDFQWAQRKQLLEKSGEAPGRVTAKRYLIERDGNQCGICSIDSWMGKTLVLILDHIDGSADNNKLTNLRLVCSNCDSQLPTYKNKNLGNGRHFRRVRYKEGKSY